MGLKPLDVQINILQMDTAAKEIHKSKETDLNKQHFAASLIEKDSKESSEKVDKVDRVEATLAPLENEVKDDRSKKQRQHKLTQEELEKNKRKKAEKELFKDPSKGFFIDIKE